MRKESIESKDKPKLSTGKFNPNNPDLITGVDVPLLEAEKVLETRREVTFQFKRGMVRITKMWDNGFTAIAMTDAEFQKGIGLFNEKEE